jgi:hypothetical protein
MDETKPLMASAALSLIAQGWEVIESDGSIMTILAPPEWEEEPKELVVDTTDRAAQPPQGQAEAGLSESLSTMADFLLYRCGVEIEALTELEREALSIARAMDGADGYLYHNPDTGTEWSEIHPVESGEVHDAMDVRSATAPVLRVELLSAWKALSEEEAVRREHERAIAHLRAELEQETKAAEVLRRECDALSKKVYQPGVWRCAKCDFQLVQSSLNARTGTVTARDEPGTVCPNDGSPMWRVSYQEDNAKAWKWGEEQFDRATKAEAELEQVKRERDDNDPQPYKDALHDLVMLKAQQEIGCIPAPTKEQWSKAWAEAEELTRVEP